MGNDNNFMDNLADQVKEDKKEQKSFTENGMVGFATSGQAIIDCNFRIPSYRGADSSTIIFDFKRAFEENPLYAVRWLFYARDPRNGLGERKVFKVLLHWLVTNAREEKNIYSLLSLLSLIPEYGRWDDLINLFFENGVAIEYQGKIFDIIKETFYEDLNKVNLFDESISLLGKWLPSETASNKAQRHRAHTIMNVLGMTPKAYRKALVSLRKKLNVVEQKMTTQKWGEIDYSTVASKANLNYKNAFKKHDEIRREEFLSQVKKGETHINASVAFPHDIVHLYTPRIDRHEGIDGTLEEMWKALPSFSLKNTLVVADGSGSMTNTIPGSSTTALEVANALAIYCAEHNAGIYKDKYITFSETPQFVDLSKAFHLLTKLDIARSYDEVANTNIKAVFDLILKTSVRHNIPQSEMPQAILIITDGEFDSMTDDKDFCKSFSNKESDFEIVKKKWEEQGYQIPRLVFWNVNSRTNTVPVQKNELGLALVSGFSPTIVKMVLSDKLEPWDALKEILDGDRYNTIKWE